MINAIAIDDEPLALKIIETFCEKSNEVNLLGCFSNAKIAMDFLKQNNIDLIFLDINMPDINGIDFVKLIPEDTFVVFTTAYEQYALQGYNLHAIDYLLKPIPFNRFELAINKVKIYIDGSKGKTKFITIRADYSDIKIEIDSVLFIEGLDDYIKFNFKNNKPIVARYTLKYILNILPKNQFVRVHKSFIINKKEVTKLKSKSVFINETEIPIGTKYNIEYP
ncbi:MAG: LytTR family DNA-binding domain-containing protein [Bacteroidetes bacterium]|nr:LytTR family DNA-binding domain-containing protein [Bacteroidota bacterium]